MKITIEVPDQRIADCLEAANSSEWAKIIRYPENMLPVVQGTVTAVIEEWADEDECIERHTLNSIKIRQGIATLATNYPHKFRDIIAEDCDMYTGDLLIQCALFGEEKYC